MKAVLCRAFGPPESLSLEELEAPTAGADEVVVDVRAAALNFPDVLMIEGKYQSQPPFPFIPGGEFAGVVASVGCQRANAVAGTRRFRRLRVRRVRRAPGHPGTAPAAHSERHEFRAGRRHQHHLRHLVPRTETARRSAAWRVVAGARRGRRRRVGRGGTRQGDGRARDCGREHRCQTRRGAQRRCGRLDQLFRRRAEGQGQGTHQRPWRRRDLRSGWR